MTVQARSVPLPLAPPGLGTLEPCAHGGGCPLGVDIPSLAHALRARDRERAYRVARAANPFPASCGYACHAPCESACTRRFFGAPVGIAALERHAAGGALPTLAWPDGPCTSAHDARSVAGLVGLSPDEALRAPRSGHRVAIVGAGAAGLACAHDLALLGHSCVLFDTAREPGGLLTGAIPGFRFPVNGARAEIAAILAMDVEYHGGYHLSGGAELRALLAAEFDAVFVAIGASTPRETPFPDQPAHSAVVDAMDVLRGVVVPTGTTLVVGDGDLAVDAARVLRRAGAPGQPAPTLELALTHALDASEAPPAAIAAAMAEGVRVHAGWEALRYVTDEAGALAGVELARRDDRVTMVVACDHVVAAGPRATDASPFAPDLAVDAEGRVLADPDTLQTPTYGVWAGGACVFGHRSIAHAIADGKRAAWQIHGALCGTPVRVSVVSAWVEVDDWDPERAQRALATPPSAVAAPTPPPVDPFAGDSPATATGAALEGMRCFDCTMLPVVDDRCTDCGACVRACPEGAFQLASGPPKALRLDPSVCTRCGICVSSCPERAIAMQRLVWEERLAAEPAAAPSLPAARDRFATPVG